MPGQNNVKYNGGLFNNPPVMQVIDKKQSRRTNKTNQNLKNSEFSFFRPRVRYYS